MSQKALKKVPNSVFDLLKRMLEVDPVKRPSAVECLSSDFFIENYEQNTEQEGQNISENLKSFQEKYKFNVRSLNKNKPAQDGMSLEFRQGVINGETRTVNDSVDFSSKGAINSLHQMNAKKNPNLNMNKEVKRESIYKAALMQHASILQQEHGDTEEHSDSDEEGDGKKPTGSKKNSLQIEPNIPDNVKRKSKFGEK